MNQATATPRPTAPASKPKRNILLIIVSAVAAICIACLAIAYVIGSNPGVRAANTQAALTEAATRLTPEPTNTPGPTATAPNTNTPQPSATPVPATATEVQRIVDVDQVVGLSLAEVEAIYGEPESIVDWDPGVFPSMPEGGETREYALESPDDFQFLVDYDLNQIATGIQLNIGLSGRRYEPDEWREAFRLIGLEVTSDPDREEPNNLYWDDVGGYSLNARWLADGLLAYVNAYRPDLVD